MRIIRGRRQPPRLRGVLRRRRPRRESLEAEEPQVKTEMAISSCLITGGNKIQIEASGNGDMENTDGYLYLFELKPYEDAIGERTDYAAWANGGASASFSLDLNRGTAQDRLYSRFVVAVKTEDGYEAVSDYHYITNPETVAENQKPYRETLSKKGLQMEVSQLGDAFQLGVKHSSVNIAFHRSWGTASTTSTTGRPTISARR